MTPQVTLIGLAGGAGTGKDTVANKHLLSLGFLPTALADELKIRVVASGKATFEEVFFTKPPHVRKLLQEEGTERGRNLYGEDYWVNILDAKLRTNAMRWGAKFSRYVITDVRFSNEVAYVKRMGGIVIRLDAPKRYAANGMSDEARTHVSEQFAKPDLNHLFDAVIANDPENEASVGQQVRWAVGLAGLLTPIAGVETGAPKSTISASSRPLDGTDFVVDEAARFRGIGQAQIVVGAVLEKDQSA